MTISANKTDSTAQAGDHAAHHNELAVAVNDLMDRIQAGGIPDPTQADPGDILVRAEGVDGTTEWQRMREVPLPAGATVGEALTRTGAGDFSYNWEQQSNQQVGWGAITKTWFKAGSSLPSDALFSPEGTVFIVYK